MNSKLYYNTTLSGQADRSSRWIRRSSLVLRHGHRPRGVDRGRAFVRQRQARRSGLAKQSSPGKRAHTHCKHQHLEYLF